MLESILRVITAFKRRFVRKVTRRSPSERLHARQYYRVHKTKIRMQRKRYMRKNKLFMRSRKLFKRAKPQWLSPKRKYHARRPKHSTRPKYHPNAIRPKKINIRKPTRPRVRKVHAPKRRPYSIRRKH